MIGLWVTVGIVALLIIVHVVWYLFSRHYQYERLADECTIREFQAQSRKKMGLDYIDMSLIQQDFVKTNGACLRINIFESAPGSPCIVFMPGTAAYALLYIELLYALYKQGFHVIGFDPRGHGESSPPRGSFTINELMDDAVEVCRYARKRFKTPVGLAGSSQGGITTFYAAAKGEVITSAMCHNVADLNGRDNLVLSQFRPPVWMIPFVRFVFKLYQNYGVPLTFYLDFSKQILKDGENSADFLKRDPLGVVIYTCKVLRALAKTTMPVPVEAIATPIMVLQATEDPIFPQAYVEAIYKRLTCPKSYTLIKGPHLILVNQVPDVVGPISDWFKKTLVEEGRAASQ
jgi:alpha-beta hydrolase superfamily lysophospholipase